MRAQQAQADIPTVTHDDLRWADGIAWGTPTRYGNMSAQMKQFIDTTGGLWLKGELEDKATGIFTSTASIPALQSQARRKPVEGRHDHGARGSTS
jgi:NAD(P)H dehydrogenase (quinone)